jgi:uncharacterized protein YjbI with pentapeptide repeats
MDPRVAEHVRRHRCKWRSELDPEYRCRVPARAGSDYCILHASGKKSASEFFLELAAQHTRRPAKIPLLNPMHDYTGYVFPVPVRLGKERSLLDEERPAETRVKPMVWDGEARLEEIAEATCGLEGEELCLVVPTESESSATFKEATFLKPLLIQGSVGDLSFDGAQFCSDLAVRWVTAGAVSFKKARLGGKVTSDDFSSFSSLDFTRARFERKVVFAFRAEDLRLSGCEFQSSVCFRHLWGEQAVFDGAKFDKAVSFEGTIGTDLRMKRCEFRSNLAFKRATLQGDIHLDGTAVLGELSFANATLAGSGKWSPAGRLSCRACAIGRLNLSGARMHGVMQLEEMEVEELWASNRAGVEISRPSASAFWSFARECYTRRSQTEAADASYFFMQIAQARSRLLGKPYITAPIGVLAYGLLWLFAYGVSFWRILSLWLMCVLAFGTIYAFCPSLLTTQIRSIWSAANWVTAMYFSATCFTTLGLGDVQPASGIARVLVSIEAMIGGVLMALTVLVIGRKFMR